MNVLALVTDAWGGRGGIAQYNRDLLEALANQPTIESIQVLTRHGPDSADSVPPKVSSSGPFGKLRFTLAAVISAMRIKRPFVVFCGHINFAPLAGALNLMTGAPIWLQVHGTEAWQRPSMLRRWAVERFQLITAVSRFTRSKLLSWAAFSPAHVKVLPNTVDTRFAPGPRNQELLVRYGLEGKKVLLTVARLSAQEQYKGHDLVISALPDLLTHFPEVRYLVAGEGDDCDRLKALAQQNGVSEQVIFAGAVAHHELPDHYRLADVFVMPSTGEGFGIAFLEAAASGAKVVGCGMDGSRDALREGRLGFIATPTREGVLEAVIRVLSSHDDCTSECSRFQRKHFIERVEALLAETAEAAP